jgi:phospholipid/cholesterol/gamma-HCH transport system ATP-binding protein
MATARTPQTVVVEVRDLALAFGDLVIQQHLSFEVVRGEIFGIMGDSGCGKSTLLRHMIGLQQPSLGEVYYDGEPYWGGSEGDRERLARRFGVLFQGAGLLSSLTLAENVALPLRRSRGVSAREVDEIVGLKLRLVGLGGFGDHYPSEISGGMRKRAGLARAMALDPEILFFDEPSAGLDPLASRRLDDLILELRDSLGTTVILVTHELPSLLELADNAVFLDAERRTIIASGSPRTLLESAQEPKVRAFLSRGRA